MVNKTILSYFKIMIKYDNLHHFLSSPSPLSILAKIYHIYPLRPSAPPTLATIQASSELR